MNAQPLRLLAGLAALVAFAALAWHGDRRQAMLSWLYAWQVWYGLSLGSLGLLLLHGVSGGGWGEALRPGLLAALRPLPLLAPAMLPLLYGLPLAYPWAVHAEPAQRWYLNRTGFALRELLLAALWCALALRLRGRGLGRRGATLGLIAYLLGVSLNGVDWVMSLQPHWHSSALGLSYAAVLVLGAAALAVLRAAHGEAPAVRRGDLGLGLLTLVLFAAYLLFMDYLTAWSANQPPEAAWYLPRTLTSWRWLAGANVLAGLLLPLLLLLGARGKRHAPVLRAAALAVLVAYAGQLLWWLAPAWRPQGLRLEPADALAWLGLGLCWRGAQNFPEAGR